MPDIRRCSIYGCKSNSRENRSYKFFNFPARDNPLYEYWLGICEESAGLIRQQRRPYICSKHFHEKDVGFRRLATGAVPSLYLKAPPGFQDEEDARLAEIASIREEKQKQINLVNDTVLEWCRRAQHYPDLAATCTTRRALRRIAVQARNLIGATSIFQIDDYWLRKFRRSHMLHMDTLDLDESRNKTLDVPTIINELDPNVILLSDREIKQMVKKEDARLIKQMQLKQDAFKRNRSPEARLKKSCKGSKKIKSFEEALNDYYGLSSELSVEENCYENMDSNIEIKSEDNDCIEVIEDELLSDEEKYSEDEDKEDADEATKSELVINTYKEALEHLKPLEDFVLREVNYRAIGLVSTLEIIFKKAINP